MAKKLTELLREAMAKGQTEEGRRELREQRKQMEAEALQAVQKAPQAAPVPPEGPEGVGDAQTAPGGPQAVEGPHEGRAVARVDPILPVVQSVREHPARQMGRLAFGGLLEGRELPAQLPLLPAPEGPRVPLLELSDYRGVPTMARGRGAPLDLRLAVASCVMTPMALRSAEGRIVTTVQVEPGENAGLDDLVVIRVEFPPRE